MGMFDRLRDFFKGSDATPIVQEENTYEKSRLAVQIVNLVDKIKKINSLDSSVWGLSNISERELKERSFTELERLKYSLDKRLSELIEQEKRSEKRMMDLEAAKWTGQKPKGMTDSQFDRFQRDEYDR